MPPKKFAAFSVRDSRSIEEAFKKVVEAETTSGKDGVLQGGAEDVPSRGSQAAAKHLGDDLGFAGNRKEHSSRGNTSINESSNDEKGGLVKVPVNEDYLFDVDVQHRELAPTFWLGPIYAVLRGSWFYQEGSVLRPCEEKLADQLEEGYLKVKPWRNPFLGVPTQSKSRPPSINISDTSKIPGKGQDENSVPAKLELQTQRLFGAYMNQVVTYQDATVAWLLTDDLFSRMSSTVYQRFAAGGHLAGTKVIRGYVELSKAKDAKDGAQEPSPSKPAAAKNNKQRRLSAPAANPAVDTVGFPADEVNSEQEPRLASLERQLSSFSDDPEKQEEEIRKANEDEIREDYKDEDGQDQNREIEHLVLVTHGIGQRLGLRMESINFIHDVNVLRKTLKSVYQTSPDLQALNAEVEKLPNN